MKSSIKKVHGGLRGGGGYLYIPIDIYMHIHVSIFCNWFGIKQIWDVIFFIYQENLLPKA